MFDRIKTRLSSEQGFTLIELLVVIIILGILTAIAVPSYLSFRGNASDAAAKANVRSAIPAAEQYYNAASTDTPAGGDDSYSGLTGDELRTFAPGVSPNVLAATNTTFDGYCIEDTEGSSTFHYEGGAGGDATIASGGCPVATYSVGDTVTG